MYVRYPREELLAVIAAEAARTGTTIVGENLGTVPEQVIEALERWDVLGLYEEQFNLYHHGARPLDPIPSRVGRRHPHPRHAGVRRRLRAATPPAPCTRTVVASPRPSAIRSVTRRPTCSTPPSSGSPASDAYLVVADLDDLVGETAPHNVPGQVLHSTWRRRLRRPTSGMLAEGDVRRRLKLLSTRSGRGAT